MRLSVVLLVVLMLAGCATGYGKSSIFGGYWSKEGPGDLIEVGFNGNGYTDVQKVNVYLLYRSGEIAKERGKPYFSMYRTIGEAILDNPMSEASASSLGGKPFGKVYVLLHGEPTPGALITNDVLAKYLGEVKGATGARSSGGKS